MLLEGSNSFFTFKTFIFKLFSLHNNAVSVGFVLWIVSYTRNSGTVGSGLVVAYANRSYNSQARLVWLEASVATISACEGRL